MQFLLGPFWGRDARKPYENPLYAPGVQIAKANSNAGLLASYRTSLPLDSVEGRCFQSNRSALSLVRGAIFAARPSTARGWKHGLVPIASYSPASISCTVHGSQNVGHMQVSYCIPTSSSNLSGFQHLNPLFLSNVNFFRTPHSEFYRPQNPLHPKRPLHHCALPKCNRI